MVVFPLLLNVIDRQHSWTEALGFFLGGVLLVVAINFTFVALGEVTRMSQLGIHQFGVLIAWDRIVSAHSEGEVIHYAATIGVGETPVWRTLRVTDAMTRAVAGWVPPEHPLRKVIDSRRAQAHVERSSG